VLDAAPNTLVDVFNCDAVVLFAGEGGNRECENEHMFGRSVVWSQKKGLYSELVENRGMVRLWSRFVGFVKSIEWFRRGDEM
jgi:hypothetical protein